MTSRSTSIALVLLCAAACGGDDNPANAEDDSSGDSSADASSSDDGDPQPTCMDGERTLVVDVLAESDGVSTMYRAWAIDDVAAWRDDSAALVRREHDGDIEIALATADGITTLDTLPDAAGYLARARLVEDRAGRTCAVYVAGNYGLGYVCEGMTPEHPSIDDIDAEHPLLAVFRPDGTLSVFSQTYASFARIDRAPDGGWNELEQYESSISYPTDVDPHGPLVCFVGAGGVPVLRGPDDSDTAVLPAATDCRVVVDDAGTRFVLTDAGFGSVASNVPMVSLDPLPQPLDGQLLDLAMLGDTISAFVRTPNGVEARGLPSGDSIALIDGIDDFAALGLAHADDHVAIVHAELSDDAEQQTFHFVTRCDSP
jgi:hypothetical protein